MFGLNKNSSVKKVIPADFKKEMTGEYLLLDVRTKPEYNQRSIKGAKLIPVSDLPYRISEIEKYKDEKVLIYCQSGVRSTTASKFLANSGFSNVYNLIGGIISWSSYNR